MKSEFFHCNLIIAKRSAFGFVRNQFLIILLTLVSNISFSQTPVYDTLLVNRLFKPYSNYFNNDREWVYSHLNKSAYLPGDDIWFTSYVLNPSNKQLNLVTSKLYAELWSPDMKLVSRKILSVTEGTANHFIHLPDSLSPGNYCFRTYTSWMRNFYLEDDLNTFITVLGREKVPEKGLLIKNEKKSDELATQKEMKLLPSTLHDYDIQFLPESGTFLEGVDNLFGIKAVDALGKGVKITGKVFSADNLEIISFSTSELGMDNMTIPKATDQQYHVKVVLPDSTTRALKLPKAVAKGLVVQVNPYRSDVVIFSVQTNETTRQLNQSYIVTIHANGVIFNNSRIRFTDGNAIQFRIRKKEMSSGIVYATVFDENLTPVAERIFYNQDADTKGSLTLHTEKLANDTVNVNIHLTDSLTTPGSSRLSISVLPGETLLNHFDNSLLSESILRPALSGQLENPNGYFEKNDIDHAVAINNLLLTQGWRKYDWPEILKDTIRKFPFPFEDEFSVEGTVKNWMENKPEQKSNITLLSPPNDLFLYFPVESDGRFKLDHLFLGDSTRIAGVASSENGKNWNRVLQMAIPEYFMGTPNIPKSTVPSEEPGKINENIPLITKGNILLKEVVVAAAIKRPFSDSPYLGGMTKTFELTKENYTRFTSMEMLLKIQFMALITHLMGGEYQISFPRGYKSFFNLGKDPITHQGGNPIMLIDGMKTTNPVDILTLPIEFVQSVAVNKVGIGGGMQGNVGVIAIETRNKPLFANADGTEPTNIKRLIVNGYAAPVKYYEPKYILPPGARDYDKYATVFWEPNLVTNAASNTSVRFFVPKAIKSINIRIEGISTEGKIFLEEQKIDLPGRN